MKRAAALVLSVSLALGCAAPAPVASERPLARTKDLHLALTLTQKTRDSIQGVFQESRVSVKQPGRETISTYNIKKPFNAFSDVLRANFGSVTQVDNVEGVQEAGADLIAVLDIDATARDPNAHQALTFLCAALFNVFCFWPGVRLVNPTKADISANVVFLTPDQKQIDTIRVEGHRREGLTPVGVVVDKASQDARASFEKSLLESPRLAEFAQERRRETPSPGTEAAPAQEAAGPVSDVDLPAYASAPAPNDFALVIAIEKYSGIPEAQFAERDARAVGKHLAALGFPERNIILLTGERAGRAAIEKYVESWLPRNVDEDSHVFVYFSGHGAPDPETRQAYLIPFDGDPKFLKNTGYPIKRLYQKLGELRAKSVLVAMDSCFSGAGGRSVLAQGARPLVMKVETDVPAGGRLAVLAAAGADEITGTDEKQGHGLFTYYFLKALNESRGGATLRQVYDSLAPRVKEAARRQNREQTPQLLPVDLGPRASLGIKG